MARNFVFIKDVETLLKQGKTEIQLPEGSRFSPAAWDLIRENDIQVSFTTQPLASVDESDDEMQGPKVQQQPARIQTNTALPQLTAIVSTTRDDAGTVGENAVNSQFFLIFDHDAKFIDIIKNPFFDGRNDADQMIVNLLAASQIAVIAAEEFSETLKDQLTDKNIQYVEISGPIEEAIKIVFNKKGGDKTLPNYGYNATNTD